MTALPAVGVLLGWVEEGQRRVEAAVGAMAPDDVPAPSALPGWTRGHVITHLARNADALVNLLTWARTGVPTPMYASPDQRNRDIEAGAGRGLAEQAADLRESAGRFAEAVGALPPEAWSACVTSAQGRQIPAAQIPWLRVREVWIHCVDLDVGVGVDALPDEVAVALTHDVAAWMSPKLDRVIKLDLDLASEPDLDRAGRRQSAGGDSVVLGSVDIEPDCVVSGPANQIAGWLTGRVGAGGLTITGTLPALPRWL